MFTGIITHIGTLTQIEKLDQGKRFTVRSVIDSATLELGASIAHNGTCLTVVEKSADANDHWYKVEAWEEALRLTTLGTWDEGQKINLERALKIGDELGGHLVSGHVDAMAQITAMVKEGQATRYTIEVPDNLAKFIAPKGSVTLDGASLTVNQVNGSQFDVLLIKHTQEVTGWGALKTGDFVNLEIDQMARYAARLSEFS